MPALPTAKWQLLRSLGVTRDGRAVEGLLASGEALTQGVLLVGNLLSPAGRPLFPRFGRKGRIHLFAALFATFAGAKGERERRRKDCCFQPLGITGLACARAPLGPQTHPRADVRKGLRRKRMDLFAADRMKFEGGRGLAEESLQLF